MNPAAQLSEWGEKGYARAIAICTNAAPSSEYPTQDVHSLTDEADFIQGFNLGMADFHSKGFEGLKAYIGEVKP